MTNINVLSRTQIITVDPATGAVSVTNAGPAGPPADPTLGPRVTAVEGEMDDLQAAETTIPGLPAAVHPIDGTELVPISQGGVTRKAAPGAVVKRIPSVAGTSNVVNTTTETTVVTWSMLANQFKSGSTLRFNILGSVVNNTGASRTTTVRLKCNGTTVASFVCTQPTNGTRRVFAEIYLFVVDIGGGVIIVLGDGMRTLGNGALTGFDENTPWNAAGAAFPAASAHDWVVTVQHSFASANLSASLPCFLEAAV